jgi:glucose/arabinose dehydrogenase
LAVLGMTGRAVLILACFVALVVASRPSRADELALERVFAGLEFKKPLLLLPAPAGAAWYVVEQRGVVWRVEPGPDGNDRRAAFADIRDRVDAGPSEAGLLGMTFHPRFAANPKVYLSYTAPGRPLVSRISEFISRDGGLTLDPTSERIVMSLDQPYANHNGGHVAFGPDGFLYIGLGDGGSGGDPHRNGQNLDTLLGKLLRINVDGGTPYAIPPDNPFAKGGGRPEIYALGLRNPWRWSFDRESGELWLADVGQNEWEEVDLVVRGGNYGWNIREGAHCFRADDCRTDGLIDPVAEYGHDEGCSITGGHVYRGKALPTLQGAYLYADYCSGRLWGLFRQADDTYEPRVLLDTGLNISSFGEGRDGELYLIDHQGGKVYRLVGK